jgi:hypothetical protein
VEAIAEWGALIHVEISQERFQNLHLEASSCLLGRKKQNSAALC